MALIATAERVLAPPPAAAAPAPDAFTPPPHNPRSLRPLTPLTTERLEAELSSASSVARLSKAASRVRYYAPSTAAALLSRAAHLSDAAGGSSGAAPPAASCDADTATEEGARTGGGGGGAGGEARDARADARRVLRDLARLGAREAGACLHAMDGKQLATVVDSLAVLSRCRLGARGKSAVPGVGRLAGRALEILTGGGGEVLDAGGPAAIAALLTAMASQPAMAEDGTAVVLPRHWHAAATVAARHSNSLSGLGDGMRAALMAALESAGAAEALEALRLK
ncbi:hypothetical protein FOA52_010778 [Chlamydomonas sp. UWO 241]|nr:hypothetical protein FOA52_010778 [Chlamydomonas sp. UWO 241]